VLTKRMRMRQALTRRRSTGADLILPCYGVFSSLIDA
jgi:hypothetical protein